MYMYISKCMYIVPLLFSCSGRCQEHTLMKTGGQMLQLKQEMNKLPWMYWLQEPHTEQEHIIYIQYM